jgi:hypothetical protein
MQHEFPRAQPARWRSEWGQSSVELVALLPLAFVVGVAVMAVLAARSAAGEAAAAAEAGAMALLQDGSPAQAAQEALPAGARRRASIRVRGRRVLVTVRPAAAPGFVGGALAATAAASAGPEPAL